MLRPSMKVSFLDDFSKKGVFRVRLSQTLDLNQCCAFCINWFFLGSNCIYQEKLANPYNN